MTDDQYRFTFDITPGLELKNAHLTTDVISINESIFSQGQIRIIQKFIADEKQSLQQRLESEFATKLDTEKRTAWQNGNQAGITLVKNQFTTQVAEMSKQLVKVIDSLSFKTDEFLAFHQEEILKLIIKLARKVIDVEVSLNNDIIITSLKRCLELLNEKEEVKIMVNPKDWGIVRQNLDDFTLSLDLPKNMEIVPNEEILEGGCRIEFHSGSIDADIETQFAEIKRNLHEEDLQT